MDTLTVENGNPITFNVKVLDEEGNVTAHPQLVVYCRVGRLVALLVALVFSHSLLAFTHDLQLD